MTRPIYELLANGQKIIIPGRRGSYLITQSLKENVFKAHIDGTSIPVMVKTPAHPVLYEREASVYEFDCIKRSPYIRSQREVTENNQCMVFEWMGCDLWSLRNKQQSSNSLFLKTVASSVLNALVAFLDMDGNGAAVHTDVNPNNILVSEASSASPSVKLADLEGLIPAGEHREHRLQGFSIRAPEIWMGHAPSSACDVWSLGLAHFISGRPLFGVADVNFKVSSVPLATSQAACSIAKIIQLIGSISRHESPQFSKEFDLAERLVEQKTLPMTPLEEELCNRQVERGGQQQSKHWNTLG
ncbi:uncharacterized protein TRUGW13939_11723 [Talaromyces rugulosus]|uniref:Protein kinase domain-containing protein n=1 Tax=Talaromyces rugulosus TaxID=121627 RepID=A0A7H8REV1_TALRU|nr:uncharacterized protein TRUGW13939_11723 [Talaromyces rugulosus]QKX64548.1 hypothetical protein TRUGW13939_11723 [Talaromyces rugulosus]